MKKSIKALALGLAVIPCALILTACGNSDKNLVDIGKDSDYVAVESSQYSAVIEEIDTGFDLKEVAKGLKSTLTIEANTNLGALGKLDIKLDSEEILKGNPDNGMLSADAIEAYMKATAKVKMTAEDQYGNEISQESNASAKQFIVNGTQYVDLSGSKDFMDTFGAEYPTKYYQVLATDEAQPIAIPEISLGDLLAEIPEGEWGQYVQLSKYESETGYKIKVVANKDFLNEAVSTALVGYGFSVIFTSDAQMYMIYENNEFAGLYFDTDAKVIINIHESNSLYQILGSSVTINASINLQLIGFNGEIDYPNFSGYVNIKELD